MGHRANLVVVSEAGNAGSQRPYELYRTSFGALNLPSRIFAGPDEALQWVRSERPVKDWYPNWDSEGGLIIDLPNRVLLFYGGDGLECTPRLLPAFLERMTQQWGGWELRFCERHMQDMIEYLGLARAVVFDEEEIRALDHGPEPMPIGEHQTCTEQPESIISVRQSASELQHYWFGLMVEDSLSIGPRFLETLDQAGVEPTSALPRERLDDYDYPLSGAFIDTAAKTVQVWWAVPLYRRLNEIRQRWPGFDVTLLAGYLAEQVEAAGANADGIRATAAEVEADVDAIIDPEEDPLIAMFKQDPKAVMNARVEINGTGQPPRKVKLKNAIKELVKDLMKTERQAKRSKKQGPP